MKHWTPIKYPQRWLWASVVVITASVALIFIVKPVWGIDFAGGSLIEITSTPENAPPIRQLLSDEFSLSATVQATQDTSIIIRLPEISSDLHDQILNRLQEKELGHDERRFESIGPTIGRELRRKSFIAVTLVMAVLVGYLAYIFRKMKRSIAPWKFGVAAAWALVHDLLLVTALFVIFGKLWDAPIDTLFVTAQLAILGYSVNDTIVLFERFVHDRSQEGSSLVQLNRVIISTLGRSLNTSFTTLLVLLALLIFGGSTIRWFIAALVAGTITGTYSSLYVAPPLLLWLVKRK